MASTKEKELKALRARIWKIIDEEQTALTTLSEVPFFTKHGRLTPIGRIVQGKHQYAINKMKEILEVV